MIIWAIMHRSKQATAKINLALGSLSEKCGTNWQQTPCAFQKNPPCFDRPIGPRSQKGLFWPIANFSLRPDFLGRRQDHSLIWPIWLADLRA